MFTHAICSFKLHSVKTTTKRRSLVIRNKTKRKIGIGNKFINPFKLVCSCIRYYYFISCHTSKLLKSLKSKISRPLNLDSNRSNFLNFLLFFEPG